MASELKNKCIGSGSPVESGSRCYWCKESFGHPHPAGLVVGKPAPDHNVADFNGTVIDMVPADAYRLSNYGIALVSRTKHVVRGKGVHNPGFNHRVEVWFNTNGTDPHGKTTQDATTVLLSATATVLSNMGDGDQYGPDLVVGERVILMLKNRSLGVFSIVAGNLCDPYLKVRQ